MIVEASREDIDIGYTWIFSISDGHKSYKRHFQFTQRLYWNILLHILHLDPHTPPDSPLWHKQLSLSSKYQTDKTWDNVEILWPCTASDSVLIFAVSYWNDSI